MQHNDQVSKEGFGPDGGENARPLKQGLPLSEGLMPRCCMRETAFSMECWLCDATISSVLSLQTWRITCSTQLQDQNECEVEAHVRLAPAFLRCFQQIQDISGQKSTSAFSTSHSIQGEMAQTGNGWLLSAPSRPVSGGYHILMQFL